MHEVVIANDAVLLPIQANLHSSRKPTFDVLEHDVIITNLARIQQPITLRRVLSTQNLRGRIWFSHGCDGSQPHHQQKSLSVSTEGEKWSQYDEVT